MFQSFPANRNPQLTTTVLNDVSFADCLIYSKSDLERLQRLIESNSAVKAGWEQFVFELLKYDNAYLDQLDERRRELVQKAEEHGGNKLFSLGNFIRSSLADSPQLAFLWRVTGNEQARRSALRLWEFAFEETEWRYQAIQNGWKSDLWTAEFCSHLALSYFQLSDSLAGDQRLSFKKGLWNRGILPILEDWIDPQKRIHALDSMGHNWWSVCVSGAGIALFALRDEIPDAVRYLTLIADSFVEFFSYPGNILQNKHRTFGEQGDYIESIGYLDYTLHDLIVLLDLFRMEWNRDLAEEIPVLKRICDYYMASTQRLHNRTQRLNFGNMGVGLNTVGAYNHNPKSVWLWLARRFHRKDLFNLVLQTHEKPTKLLEFLYWPEDTSLYTNDTGPNDMVFENGIAVLRNGYASESTVFAIRTGEIWNHNQSDVGTFILSASGREFLIDSGAMEYSNPLYWSYLRTSEAHNVIRHSGNGPDPDLDYHGTKFMGSVPVLLSAPDYKYLLADCCGPWQPIYRRFYRHVVWADDFILLIDDLYAYTDGEWCQLWHYAGTATVKGDDIHIVNEEKTLTIRRLFPIARTDEFRQGFLPRLRGDALKHEYQLEEIKYLATKCEGPGVRQKFINLLLLPGHLEKQVHRINGTDYEGVETTDEQGSWKFICNHLADGRKMHQNSEITIGNLRTDAFIVGLHTNANGELDRFSFHNGSFLHLGSRTLHSSLLKMDATVVLSGKQCAIHSHATSPTRAYFGGEGADLNAVQLPGGTTSMIATS